MGKEGDGGAIDRGVKGKGGRGGVEGLRYKDNREMGREETQRIEAGSSREEFVGVIRKRSRKIPEVEMEVPVHLGDSKLDGQQTKL